MAQKQLQQFTFQSSKSYQVAFFLDPKKSKEQQVANMAMKAYCGNTNAETKEKPPRGPVESIKGPCQSVKLDQILSENVELKVSYHVPDCEAIKYVSDKTTGMEAPVDPVRQLFS